MGWTDPETGHVYCCSDRHALVSETVTLLPGTAGMAVSFPWPAWVIEIEHRGAVGYWSGRTMDGHGAEWTPDPRDAIGFATEQDALRLVERLPIRPARVVCR